ncbi:hypothetical protein ACG2DA_20815, partial [Alienimonas sp. DA493]
MHWPPADRSADSHADLTDDAGGDPVAFDGGRPDDGAPHEAAAGGAYEPSPTFASTFAAYDAGAESPWPNRIVWSAAAAAAVCGGVWFTGLWEVRLDEPPAGALAESPDAAPQEDALGEGWAEDDWPENGAPGSEADLAALWGDEPEPAAGQHEHDHEHAAAFELMADAPAGDALDNVSLTPPKTTPAPAPADPLVSADDRWSDPTPAAAPAMPAPHRNADEPAGGLFASTARPTPVAPAPGSLPPGNPPPGNPSPRGSADRPAVKTVSAEPAPSDTREAVSLEAASASASKAKPAAAPAADPFGGDPVAPA